MAATALTVALVACSNAMPKPDHPPTSLEMETAMHPVLEAQIRNNPTPAEVYVTLALIAKHGKS